MKRKLGCKMGLFFLSKWNINFAVMLCFFYFWLTWFCCFCLIHHVFIYFQLDFCYNIAVSIDSIIFFMVHVYNLRFWLHRPYHPFLYGLTTAQNSQRSKTTTSIELCSENTACSTQMLKHRVWLGFIIDFNWKWVFAVWIHGMKSASIMAVSAAPTCDPTKIFWLLELDHLQPQLVQKPWKLSCGSTWTTNVVCCLLVQLMLPLPFIEEDLLRSFIEVILAWIH